MSWRLATEPEVFMLNAALALALVAIASPRPWVREDRRAMALAFVAGLGISNHHTIVLLAPLGLFAWGAAIRATDRKVLAAAGSVVALALGVLPYAYLVHAAGEPCSWGDTSTLQGLLHHFLRRDYGTTQLGVSDANPEPLQQILWLGHSLVESGIAVTLLLAVGVAVQRRRWSWRTAMLVGSLVLAGPVFVSRFNLPPRGLMALVVVRFHELPLALASILGAIGIDALIDVVRSPRLRRFVVVAMLAIVFLRGGLSGPDVASHHRPTTERYLRNALTLLPERAILIAAGDDVVGGLEYMQCALRERTDVIVVDPRLMLADWYGHRTDRKLGFPVVHGSLAPGATQPSLDGVRLTEQLLASDRPVFVTKWFLPNLPRLFPSYPVGPLIRLERKWSAVPAPTTLLEINEGAFSQMTLDDSPPSAHTWAGIRYADYARPWTVLADAFAGAGDPDTASRCRTRAENLTPSD